MKLGLLVVHMLLLIHTLSHEFALLRVFCYVQWTWRSGRIRLRRTSVSWTSWRKMRTNRWRYRRSYKHASLYCLMSVLQVHQIRMYESLIRAYTPVW